MNNINKKDKNGNTLLHRTVSSFDIDNLKLFIKQGGDILIKNNYGQNVLDYAINLKYHGLSNDYLSNNEINKLEKIIELLKI
jgi:ankyrin repeat protein